MKHNLLIIALLMVCALPLAAQTDEIRISLTTSQGAEIGIDGDISSTNIMRTKVTPGNHIVTVTYGTSYKQEYPINVTPTNTVFEFLVDGQLSLNTVPSGSRVFIDGIDRGRAPIAIPMLGTHNLRVENDKVTYFDYTDRVTVKPFEQLDRTVTLRKRPPRTYGMVLANYAPMSSGAGGFGATFAVVKRWGVYLRFLTTGDSDDEDRTPFGNYEGKLSSGPGIFHSKNEGLTVAAAGLMFRLNKFVYAYVGSGYGNYNKELELDRTDPRFTNLSVHTNSISPYHSEGVLADAGLILKWKALLLQAGYNRFFGDSTPDPYQGIYFGLGFTIHKQRKDK